MEIDRRLRFAGAMVAAVLLLPLAISSRRFGIGKDEEASMRDGDRISVFANVVRPLNATCEKYSYFDFPYCPPGEPMKRPRSLDDIISGDCYTNTAYELAFQRDVEREVLCEKRLTKADVSRFRDAVKRKFVYQFSYRKHMMPGEMGRIEQEEEEEPKYFLSTHVTFYIKCYGDRIIEMSILRVPDSDVDITKPSPMTVNFTYSVEWGKFYPSRPIPADANTGMGKSVVNWVFSLSDWVIIVLMWFSVLVVVQPYLWRYFNRFWDKKYSDTEVPNNPLYFHGENCMCPLYTSLLGAILGNGVQLVGTVILLLILARIGVLNACDTESLFYNISKVHCFFSVVAGLRATSFHASFTPIGSKECILLTATIFSVPVLATALFANHLAVRNGVLVPDRGIIIENMIRWGIFSVMGVSFGSILDLHFRPASQPPCATARLPRETSQLPWFSKTPMQILLCGIIPSVLLLPKMDYIYASLWGLKLCGAYNTVESIFTGVFIATAIIAFGITNYELVKQDHQWQWRSVLRGGSPAVFMFGYGIYFFSRAESEHGSIIRGFGYSACISYALFIILGTIGYYASALAYSTFSLPEHHE